MLVTIPDVLDDATLKQVREILDRSRFVDGRLSAGMAARRVKNNEEMADDPQTMERINNLVMGSLVRNPVYQAAALPLKVATPFYARYQPGKYYGDHVDDPIMGAPQRYRTDVSITLFLNEPEEYDGGELVVRTEFGNQEVKLPAGHAVMYPSSSIHHINEVTRGERLVAVTWVQSMIRSPEQRALLYQLHQARETLLRERPEAPETKQVDISYVNLVRMWAEL